MAEGGERERERLTWLRDERERERESAMTEKNVKMEKHRNI